MPRKPTRVGSHCVQTTHKQDDEDGPSQDSITLHSSASHHASLDGNQAGQVSASLPSRPARASKKKCRQQLPAAITSDSESVEDHEQCLNQKPQNVPKSITSENVAERKQHLECIPRNYAKCRTNRSDKDNNAMEDRGEVKNIKIDPSNEESEQWRYNSASTSISEPLLASRPTRAAKVKCLQQISEAVSQGSSDDESPAASHRRNQQQINRRQYAPKNRFKESVEQDEQRVQNTIEYGKTQIISESVEKLELQDQEWHSRDADTYLVTVERVKTEPSSPECDQFIDVIASGSIADQKPNVNEEDNTSTLRKCEQLGSISGNEFNTEGVCLDVCPDEEYEVTRVLKMEIDIKCEGPQQIGREEVEIPTVSAIKVENVNNMQKPSEKQSKGDIDNATDTVTTSKDTGKKRIKKFRPALQQNLQKTQQDVHISIDNNKVVHDSCQNIVGQDVPTCRSRNCVKQGKQHLPKVLECRSTQTVSEHVDRDYQHVSKYRANKQVKEHEQDLETEQHCAIKAKGKLSDEQRQRRNEKARQRYLKQKAKESVEEREKRLERRRQNHLKRKANENVEQREKRLQRIRQSDFLRKTNESFQQREKRLSKQRRYYASKVKGQLSVEQLQQRYENVRQWHLERKANESVEERDQRLDKHRQYYATKVKGQLSAEQLKQRNERLRQWHLKRKANESVEKREQRLQRGRQNRLQRKANQVVKRREKSPE